MTPEQVSKARGLEGHHVGVALASGDSIDDAVLQACDGTNLWIYASGFDVALATADVRDLWELTPGTPGHRSTRSLHRRADWSV